MDLNQRVMEQMEKGHNCSQTMMQLSLDMRERDEPFTIRAMGALGGGMHACRTCGTLTGGVCMLASYFTREDGENEPEGYKPLATELVEWFENEYGSLECRELVATDVESMLRFCPGLMVRTFEKCVEILEAAGIDPTE